MQFDRYGGERLLSYQKTAQNESKSLAHFTQSSCGLSTTEAYYRSLAPHSYWHNSIYFKGVRAAKNIRSAAPHGFKPSYRDDCLVTTKLKSNPYNTIGLSPDQMTLGQKLASKHLINEPKSRPSAKLNRQSSASEGESSDWTWETCSDSDPEGKKYKQNWTKYKLEKNEPCRFNCSSIKKNMQQLRKITCFCNCNFSENVASHFWQLCEFSATWTEEICSMRAFGWENLESHVKHLKNFSPTDILISVLTCKKYEIIINFWHWDLRSSKFGEMTFFFKYINTLFYSRSHQLELFQ